MNCQPKSTFFMFGLFISLLLSNTVFAKKSTKLNFSESNIDVPFKLTHPIMLIDLLPTPGKEIVTFSIDDEENHWLITYLYNNQSKTYLEADRQNIPKNLYAFDVTKYYKNKMQKLYFLSSNNLYRYDISAKSTKDKFKTIATINSFALGNDEQYLSKGDFVQDLNNDQLDDILIADFNKTHILTAQQDGSMLSQSLPIKPQIQLSNDSANYSKTKIYFSDVNFDQRIDIITVGDGEFEYYLQNDNNSFSKQPLIQPINKLISGLDWWNKRGADGENLDQSKLIYKKVAQIKDINNDAITDMVVIYTKSSGVLDRTNDYEVYLGQNKQGKLVFSDQPNSVIKADGTLTGLEFVDIDNDKKSEVMLAGFDIGLSQIISALLSGSIDQDVHLFKMDKDDNFNPDLKISKEVQLNFSISSGTSGSPVVKLADINGDGLQDLVLSDGDDKLKAYFGVTGNDLFSKKPYTYKVSLPKQGDMVICDDLNGDGKEDLLIKYGRDDDIKMSKVFKVLLSS